LNIEEYIMNKEWKFSELLQLTDTSREVAKQLYQSAHASEMLEELWDKKIDANDITLGELYHQIVMDHLTKQVMEAFKKYFESATVSFDRPTLLEAQTGIVEEPKPTPPKPKTINKKLNTDGTDLPPGVERI